MPASRHFVRIQRMKKSLEAKSMFKLTVRISPPLAEEVKIRAVREGKTLQEITATALATYLRSPLRKGDER